MKRFHVILHPTDFSPGSDAAFQYACDLARDYDARLAVVYAVEPISPITGDGIMIPFDQTDIMVAAQTKLDNIQAVGPAVRTEKLLRVGPAAAAIVAAAHELNADLIVMGTHGRTGLGRLLIGSVAEAVLRKADCPVLTVKAHTPANEGRPEPAAGKSAS